MADADPEDMHRIWEFPEGRKGKSTAVSMVVLKEVREPRGDLSAACDRIMMLENAECCWTARKPVRWGV